MKLIKAFILSIILLVLILPAYIIDFLIFIFTFSICDEWKITFALLDLTINNIK